MLSLFDSQQNTYSRHELEVSVSSCVMILLAWIRGWPPMMCSKAYFFKAASATVMAEDGVPDCPEVAVVVMMIQSGREEYLSYSLRLGQHQEGHPWNLRYWQV